MALITIPELARRAALPIKKKRAGAHAAAALHILEAQYRGEEFLGLYPYIDLTWTRDTDE
ncbi:hypothetical protein [Sorangium sp. So ce363]|uniref:hypothetical protein n=1 Tax=Sorangium sp. So ce363 TaxID=3133304 RepID=UPI003F62A250